MEDQFDKEWYEQIEENHRKRIAKLEGYAERHGWQSSDDESVDDYISLKRWFTLHKISNSLPLDINKAIQVEWEI